MVRRALGALRDARAAFPALRVRFSVDPAAGTEGREYGFYDEESRVIGLAPRLAKEPRHRQSGIVRHELGHAIAHQYGRAELAQVAGPLPPGDEALADSLAAFVWGEAILYDGQAVQSTEVGHPKRPGFLHR